jgi:hypothetical protein
LTNYTPDALLETLKLLDVESKTAEFHVTYSDELTLDDGGITDIIIRVISENLKMNDSKLFDINKSILNNLILSDIVNKSASRLLSDGLNLSDGDTRYFTRILSDNIELLDEYSRVWDSTKILSNTLKLTHTRNNFNITRQILDSLKLSDGAEEMLILDLSETIELKDYCRPPLLNRELSTNTKFAMYTGTYQQVINDLDADQIPEHKVKGFSYVATGKCIAIVHKH